MYFITTIMGKRKDEEDKLHPQDKKSLYIKNDIFQEMRNILFKDRISVSKWVSDKMQEEIDKRKVQ